MGLPLSKEAKFAMDAARGMKVEVQIYEGMAKAVADWEPNAHLLHPRGIDGDKWYVGASQVSASDGLTPESVAELVCSAVRRLMLSAQELDPQSNGTELEFPDA